MAVIKDFEVPSVDEETVFPALQAANFVASVLLQMLITHKGAGAWIEEVHENMRNSLDRGPPDAGWPGTIEQWQRAQHAAVDAIFMHQHMVGSVRPKN